MIQPETIYYKGMRVALWEMHPNPEHALGVVLRQVIVTVTETKTGTPGRFSQIPVGLQSLKGTGDDGRRYEKHWDFWPEDQSRTFINQWTSQKNPDWTPQEAVAIHNNFACCNQGQKDDATVWPRNTEGKRVVPEGDVKHCPEHGYYYFSTDSCFMCRK